MATPSLATPLNKDGKSGDCVWKFESSEGGTVFTISPVAGTEGKLGVAGSDGKFPWHSESQHVKETKRIVVESGVKAGSSLACIFSGFEKATSIDHAGLVVTDATTDMQGMFENCFALTTIGDVKKWKTSKVTNMANLFRDCSALTTLDLSEWSVSNVTNMESMFSGCSALTSLNLGKWNAPESVNKKEMFLKTPSLKDITLGKDFHIKGDAKFEDAGSNVGSNWAQVAEGTVENPQGKVFASAQDLANFHHDRTKRQTDDEQYVRVTSTFVITFDKGADDVTGTMETQSFVYGVEPEPLAKNTYQREGHEFDGWKDPEGNSYTDEQLFKNTMPGVNVQKTLTAQWKLKTYTVTFDVRTSQKEKLTVVPLAPLTVEHGKDLLIPLSYHPLRRDHKFLGWKFQGDPTNSLYPAGATIKQIKRPIACYSVWEKLEKVALTYKSKDFAKLGFEEAKEYVVLNDKGESEGEISIEGFEVPSSIISGLSANQGIKWIAKRGGTEIVSGWSHLGAKLGADEIKAAALKDGKLVATTFEAELVDVCTITFVGGGHDGETKIEKGKTFKFVAPIVTPNNHDFKGIMVGTDAVNLKQVGEEITIDGNVTVTYKFAPKVIPPVTSPVDPVTLTRSWDSSALARSSSSGVSKPKRKASLAPSRNIKTPAQQATGWCPSTEGGAQKWYFYGKDGKKLLGQHQLVGGKNGQLNWFYFDEKTGEQVRGWKHFDHQNKWCYYSTEDGAMLKGQHELKGGNDGGKHWFYFDEVTGAQIRGWKPIAYQNKWCYYSDADGRMLKGQHELEGGIGGGKHWFYFDEVTGAQIRGWKPIAYQNKWCYYSDADGTMLKGQHELEGGDAGGKHWFYFDEETGAELRNCWKEIPSQNKICYYGSDGAMYKGWCVVDGTLYYFDEETGARR